MKKFIAALLGMAVMSAPFAHDFGRPHHPYEPHPHHGMRHPGPHHHGHHPHMPPPPRHRVVVHEHYHGSHVADAIIIGSAIVTAAAILSD
ncbi:MAG: hypothetical protein IK089_06575 [Oxalobacter sp.]|nr:hypothetical protein [Oxalobacter sp.]MBR6000902.1 hypothetical protein [Oxalobacter sp.]